MYYHLTLKSDNRKTGPIAVTTSPKKTCPRGCPWKEKGCYAFYGPLHIHWLQVSGGNRGKPFNEHIKELKALPRQLIRLNQAGDLPGNGKTLWSSMTRSLIEAGNSNGKRAIVYTHYKDAKSLRFLQRVQPDVYSAINISCDSPKEVDKFTGANLPMVSVIPKEDKVQFTPKGRRIVRCPAEYQDWVSCASCGAGKPLCARKERDYVIGFYPHGVRKGKMLLEVKNEKI